MAPQNADTRTESDSLGEMRLPANSYYGATTQRAVENFPVSGIRFQRRFIHALAAVKHCAALVNKDLGTLEPKLADAIADAALEVAEGKHDHQFVLDIFQTGSGTSTNMNANEVIANLANKALGQPVGTRSPVHPNDSVNKGQSSNDVIPTAIHVAAALAVEEALLPAMDELAAALAAKAKQFWDVVKTGRTHLQDATPIRLGQEFQGYQGQVESARSAVADAAKAMRALALGGTAVGTGIGTHPEFAKRVAQRLSKFTGHQFSETANHFQAQSAIDDVVRLSGALKAYAVALLKICNDIRWLGSGPRAGIGEIELPTVQPGSSIMPGKVNPVIAESAAMVCAQVIGNDAAVTIAGQSGNFELNVMLPVAHHNLDQSIELLAAASANFSRQCIQGIAATGQGPGMVERGLAIGTALAPVIGYDAAAAIAKEAAASGATIREVALKRTNLGPEQLDPILDPLAMTEPDQ